MYNNSAQTKFPTLQDRIKPRENKGEIPSNDFIPVEPKKPLKVVSQLSQLINNENNEQKVEFSEYSKFEAFVSIF